MSRSLQRRLQAAALLAMLLAMAPARAATPGQATVVLRGPQAADVPTPAPAAPQFDPGVGPPPAVDYSPIPRFQDAPAPRFSLDAAPRLGGLDQTGGGAQCRTACAETRYQCRVAEDADVCDAAWAQCVASCTEASPGRL